MRLQTYEISFTGQAGGTLCTTFDGCVITMGPGASALPPGLSGQSAVSKLLGPISCFRPELTELRLDGSHR